MRGQVSNGQQREVRPVGGRVPPNDLDAEAYVLSELMLRDESFDEVPYLQSEHFYSEPNRRIMESIVALHTDGNKSDMVAVATWLRDRNRLHQVGGTPYLAQLTNTTPTLGNVVQHAKTITEKWRLRRTIQACHRFAAEGYGDCGDVQVFVEEAENELARIAHMEQRVTLEQVGEIMARNLPSMEQAKERRGEVIGIPTGYVELDRKTGGLYDGDLIIIAGRPGMGKTAFATNLAINISKPPPNVDDAPVEKLSEGVAFFSLEMPRDQIAKRVACNIGKVDVAKVRQNRLDGTDWSDIISAVNEMQHYPFWVDDTPAITLLELRSRVRKLKREIETERTKVRCKRLGLVVVDYLQLMQGERRQGDNREREVSSLSAGLKRLAKEEGIPVCALSQLNRGVEKSLKKDKRPTLADLRESGAIEQDADVVIFLYRPSYYDKGEPKLDCEVIVAKQRNGPTGTVELRFEHESLRFYSGDQAYDEVDFDQFDDFDR